MTQGLLDPDDYYYRRLFTDAARAVEAARDTKPSTRTGSWSPGAARAAPSPSP